MKAPTLIVTLLTSALASANVGDSGYAVLTKSRHPGKTSAENANTIICQVYGDGKVTVVRNAVRGEVSRKEVKGGFLPDDVERSIKIAGRTKLETGTEIMDAPTLQYWAATPVADHFRPIELLTTTTNRKFVLRERRSQVVRALIDQLDWICGELE